MGEDNRDRHEFFGFVGCVTEHHTLIAGALLVVGRFVHALGDVGRLAVESDQNREIVGVETEFPTIVANVVDRFANDLLNVDIGGRGNFAGDEHQPGRHKCLTGDAGIGVVG